MIVSISKSYSRFESFRCNEQHDYSYHGLLCYNGIFQQETASSCLPRPCSLVRLYVVGQFCKVGAGKLSYLS